MNRVALLVERRAIRRAFPSLLRACQTQIRPRPAQPSWSFISTPKPNLRLFSSQSNTDGPTLTPKLDVNETLSEKFGFSDDIRAETILRDMGQDKHLLSISENATLTRVADKFRRHKAGACLVESDDSNKRIVGIISESDVLRGFEELLVQENADLETVRSAKVGEWMTPASKMMCVGLQDTAYYCLCVMMSTGIRFLPILDQRPQSAAIIGLVRLRDVLHSQRKMQLSKEDMETFAMDHSEDGAKSLYVNDIMPRQGLPALTSIQRDIGSKVFRLETGVAAVAAPNKKQGEDAYFISSNASSQNLDAQNVWSVIGVADGVGSWAFEHNIDVSRFSRTLIDNCEKYCSDFKVQEQRHRQDKAIERMPRMLPPDPFRILEHSWGKVEKERIPGGSTICVLSLDGESHRLAYSNLGDCGFIVIRHSSGSKGTIGATDHGSSDFKVVFRSPQQLHYFNCPAQLGITPEGETNKYDLPADAANGSVYVEEGDLVVLASDGLYDNVFEKEILQICGTSSDPNVIAKKLTQRALELSQDRMTDSPFAEVAKENNIPYTKGGREDDITVIVSRVTSAAQQSENPSCDGDPPSREAYA